MATRRRAREVALQLLFENDFGTDRSESKQSDLIGQRMRGHKALSHFAHQSVGRPICALAIAMASSRETAFHVVTTVGALIPKVNARQFPV